MTRTIYDVIRDEHEVQRDLAEQLLETEGDSVKRRRLFDTFKQEALDHASVEERVFYTRLLDEQSTQDQARHSLEEHEEAESLLEELDGQDMSSTDWLTRFKKLVEDLQHHMDEEESEVFEKAKTVIGEPEAERMAQAYREQKPQSAQTSRKAS